MFTTLGFYESQDGAAVDHKVAGIQDDHIRAEGDNVYVPEFAQNIIGKAVLSGADTSVLAAKIESPSLRVIANPCIEPIVNALVFGNPPEGILHPLNPTPVRKDEALNLVIESDSTTATVEYGLIWLSDGNQSPYNGPLYSMRATAAITLAAGKWVNGNIVFESPLPVGEYEVVGMRARGTNLVAARLNFQGYFNRPGVPAVNAIGDLDHRLTRYGNFGSFGRFHSTTPPTLECLGVTDTSQVIILDLVKLS